MDFFDFFFPEQAEASHLRRISHQMEADRRARRRDRAARSASSVDAGRVAELEADVQFLSMTLMAVLKRLDEQQILSIADLSDLFDRIDTLDGRADGGLSVDVLRGALGAVRASDAAESDARAGSPATPKAPVSKRRLHRYRR